MGTGWRRVFCTTVPRERRETTTTSAGGATSVDKKQSPNPRLARSNPPSPHLRCNTTATNKNNIDLNLISRKAECKITPKCHVRSPKIRFGSNPSSPRSPFSILKNTLLRLSRNSCGVCMERVNKRGQGMAIYTAECSHVFHFPCIASHVRKQSCLICPVCTTTWKDVPLLAAIHTQNQNHDSQQAAGEENIVLNDSTIPTKHAAAVSSPKFVKHSCELKSYADDEPLLTPEVGENFVPIPEGNDDDEFQGFFVNPISSSDDFFHFKNNNNRDLRNVELSLLPEAAIISQGRAHVTYAVVLKVKAPPAPPLPNLHEAARRAAIDLVTVLDVSGSMTGAKLEMLKRAMRLVISSLGSADRLSIVEFSAASRRLLPLRRMTPQGQRSARRIIDRLSCSRGCSMAEALKQATRVLQERRERNPVASIILLSDAQDDGVLANSEGNQRGSSHTTRFTHVEIPVHSSGFCREPAEEAFSKCVSGLLSVVVQNLRIQLDFASGSDSVEITAVYSCHERPTLLGLGCILLGDLYAEEEKELLVEIRVPASRIGSHHVISTKCCYKDPANRELIYGRDQALLVPRPQTVLSGSPRIECLRNAFISSRAIAESRRLIEHNELSSAMQLLSSARALLFQSRLVSAAEYVKGLEAEMAEVQWRRNYQQQRVEERENMAVFVDANGEPLTPTSAWRAAEKLSKVAQMKKALNRVGFENARF